MNDGDYDRRAKGLLALYMPKDLLAYDVHIRECLAGTVARVNYEFVVPYIILRGCCLARGMKLGTDDVGIGDDYHPCRYLHSAIRIKGHVEGYYPPLVISAYDELMDARRKINAATN